LETWEIIGGLKSYQIWNQKVRLLSEKVDIPYKNIEILRERPKNDNLEERERKRVKKGVKDISTGNNLESVAIFQQAIFQQAIILRVEIGKQNNHSLKLIR
jgi:hypothetical protein